MRKGDLGKERLKIEDDRERDACCLESRIYPCPRTHGSPSPPAPQGVWCGHPQHGCAARPCLHATPAPAVAPGGPSHLSASPPARTPPARLDPSQPHDPLRPPRGRVTLRSARRMPALSSRGGRQLDRACGCDGAGQSAGDQQGPRRTSPLRYARPGAGERAVGRGFVRREISRRESREAAERGATPRGG